MSFPATPSTLNALLRVPAAQVLPGATDQSSTTACADGVSIARRAVVMKRMIDRIRSENGLAADWMRGRAARFVGVVGVPAVADGGDAA